MKLIVFDTQEICLLTKLKILVKFWHFGQLLHIGIFQQPVDLQKTAAPTFGVAHGVLFNNQNKNDLRSQYAGQQAVFHSLNFQQSL